jgi:hypothetical protein
VVTKAPLILVFLFGLEIVGQRPGLCILRHVCSILSPFFVRRFLVCRVTEETPILVLKVFFSCNKICLNQIEKWAIFTKGKVFSQKRLNFAALFTSKFLYCPYICARNSTVI